MEARKTRTITVYIAILFIARIVIGATAYYLSIVFSINTFNAALNGLGLLEQFVIVVIFAPIFETAIFQFGIIELINKINWLRGFRYLNLVAIIISSLFFSLSHFQSYVYLISSLISGILYASSYVFVRHRFDASVAAIVIAVSHCLYNSFVFATEYLSNADKQQ